MLNNRHALRVLNLCLFAMLTLEAKTVHLRCESLSNPLGIDAERPSLSWQSDSKERNWEQTAYQVLVASREELLKPGRADVWDSGRKESSASVGIVYGGPPPESRKRYYWSVRVWDQRHHVAQALEPSWWEMGLLRKTDWSAKWIRWENPEETADESGIKWIWVQGQDAPGRRSVAVFHLGVDLPEVPFEAVLFLVAHNDWSVAVNGHDAGAKSHWNEFDRREIGKFLVVGNNSIDVTVTGLDAAPPGTARAAFAGLLKFRHADGTIERIGTDERWQGRLQADTQWLPAAVVGEVSSDAAGHPGPLPQPAALLRKTFTVAKHVQSARAYVTALGGYELSINGQKVGNAVLAPGFTEFTKRVQYQTYDVTSLLSNGTNVVGAILANGWFGSGLSWNADHFKLLPPVRLCVQLEMTYTDGTRDVVTSNESWKAAGSPILHSEIYAGETYDARLEQPGWNRSEFSDNNWTPAVLSDEYHGTLSSQIDAPPQVVSSIKPERVTPLPDGSYVFDMGQNMVGWVALKLKGAAGTAVRLRFAEILNPDGTIYRTNLRNADATDTYTLRGGGEETFVPRFTFHGFRYVEVSGYPGQPTLADVTGEVVSSLSGEPSATLTTSSELVNRMWKIGIWGQRGNFLSIPTDCPQRDERLGWMGDAGVFWRTGSYNFDIAAFTHKWTRDVDDAQLPDGAFSNVSPNIGVGDTDGAPGWGDAGVIVPWTAWLQYSDRSAIERNWDGMERWMKFIADANPDYIRKNKLGPNFADWLAPDPNTSKELVATAYWALIADMMSQMAQMSGKQDAAKRYADLYSNIRTAFAKTYISQSGEVGSGTQTSYVVALHMNLVPPALESAAVNNLVKNIEAHNGHLTTGFLGTPFLLFALSNHGRSDVAYRLLLSDTYPSWGYMLSKGATTWWERWDGDTGDPSMNSYNHYAFGSVVAWVYRSVVGIDTSPSGAGFREIVIHPRPDDRMTEASGEYASVYGKIATAWKRTSADSFSLHVTLPANTNAKVFLPMLPNSRVTENGKTIRPPDEAGNYVVRVGSGSYDFQVK